MATSFATIVRHAPTHCTQDGAAEATRIRHALDRPFRDRGTGALTGPAKVVPALRTKADTKVQLSPQGRQRHHKVNVCILEEHESALIDTKVTTLKNL